MNDRRRLAVKRRAARAFSVWPRARPRRVILSYHAVGSGPWSTPVEAFRAQLGWLASNVRLRTVDQMLDLPPTSDDLQVAVTFDDGYQSVLTTAAPMLRQAGVSPTLFVNTSCLGDAARTVSDPARGYYPHEPFLLWHEVAQLRAAGWGIGSHGTEHPDLTGEPVPRIREQMMRSKQMLEDRLHSPCTMFAYPFGRHDARVRTAAADSGYSWALGSVHGPLGHRVERYAVPRIDIRRNYELQDFIGLIRGDWDYLHFLQTARHAFRVFS